MIAIQLGAADVIVSNTEGHVPEYVFVGRKKLSVQTDFLFQFISPKQYGRKSFNTTHSQFDKLDAIVCIA